MNLPLLDILFIMWIRHPRLKAKVYNQSYLYSSPRPNLRAHRLVKFYIFNHCFLSTIANELQLKGYQNNIFISKVKCYLQRLATFTEFFLK